MARRLPSKIKIGYAVYKIKHLAKKRNIDNLRKKGKKPMMGECEFSSQNIRVYGRQGEDEFANTILHEILHAINDVHKVKIGGDKKEEYLTTRYADCLLTLFKDNPKFLLWLHAILSKRKLD